MSLTKRSEDYAEAFDVADWPDIPDRTCAACGRTLDSVRCRINLDGRPVLCARCFAEQLPR